MMRLWRLAAVVLGCFLTGSAWAAQPPNFTFDTTFNAQAAANQSNTAVQTYAGDPNKIKDNLAQPLMSGTPMTAFNGTQFNARLGCQSSNAFLELLAPPTATGDIVNAAITQDLDMDGNVDRAYSLPVTVSGVCANGVISCDPGTWNNCQPYEWNADSSGNLTLVNTLLSRLGGCYCINNHCGNNLVMSNLSRVLGDLGGGAASAMAGANPVYTISNVTVDGPSIKYYGQDTSRCGQPGNANVAGYFSNSAAMSGDAFAATMSNNIYNLITNSPATQATASAQTGAPGLVQSCQQVVDATVVEQASCTPYSQFANVVNSVYRGDRIWYGARAFCDVTRADGLQGVGVYVMGEHRGTGWIGITVSKSGQPTPTLIAQGEACGGYGNPCDTATVFYSGAGCSANECSYQFYYFFNPRYNPLGYACTQGGTPGRIDQDGYLVYDNTSSTCYQQVCTQDIGCSYQSVGSGTPVMDNALRLTLNFTEPHIICNTNVTINNACAPYETNPRCNLRDETVDGVTTYQNYNPTGLSPLPSTRVVTGNYCAVPVTRDWWVRDRKYLCREDGGYSFDTAWQRIATVKDSASTTSYNDYRLDPGTGQWANENNRPLSMPPTPPAQTCMQVCKTRKPRAANDTARSGVSQDPRTSNTVYDFFYHECGQDNVCPAAAGEDVLKACQCVNDFAEVTAIMQTMRLAGRDLICTGGTLVSP